MDKTKLREAAVEYIRARKHEARVNIEAMRRVAEAKNELLHALPVDVHVEQFLVVQVDGADYVLELDFEDMENHNYWRAEDLTEDTPTVTGQDFKMEVRIP